MLAQAGSLSPAYGHHTPRERAPPRQGKVGVARPEEASDRDRGEAREREAHNSCDPLAGKVDSRFSEEVTQVVAPRWNSFFKNKILLFEENTPFSSHD